MPALSKTRFKAYSFMLLNAALWGFAAPVIKYSLNFATPAQFLFFRYIIATLIFFPIFLLHNAYSKSHHPKTDFKWLLALALLGTPLTLLPLFYGIQATSSIEASILESSSPIFIILGSMVILKETLKKSEWVGLTVAVAGTLLLALEPILVGTPLASLSMKGNLLVIISDIIWATFLIYSKKVHIDPINLTFTSFVVSIPFFLIMILVEGTGFSLSSQAVPGILFMAIGGSIIAFWAYQEGQKLIEASEAAIFTYLKPAFSIPLSIAWLKEPFSPVTMIATAIIISGVYLSEKR
jgi:drug/metabolite transporter (DMT)-like permease